MTTAQRFRSRWLNTAFAVTLALAVSTAASAHRTDEYLQAARVSIEPDSVDVYLDLTPGMAVAEPIVRVIDGDGDGLVSADEQQSYARSIVGDLKIELDGDSLPLRLLAAEFPAPSMFLLGEGTVRLHAAADTPRVSPGPHALVFRNSRRDVDSVYLANALVPESNRVQVVRQRRNEDQTELRIDYSLQRGRPGTALGPLAVSLALTGATVFFLRKRAVGPRQAVSRCSRTGQLSRETPNDASRFPDAVRTDARNPQSPSTQ